ncbi:hypothetical protein lbkm_3838 [Lachnospiraceae bacterium KM106-2]|nr:hypothetical protein lbkm_3838 [Lachnospiraceae bacterium KM106-2]
MKCPYCGYIMPIKIADKAIAKGIYVRCKGRTCKKEFELKINIK